jgi:hypothetical protein
LNLLGEAMLQRCRPGRGWTQKRLLRIGNDAAADDNLIGCAHKFLVGRKKAQQAQKNFSFSAIATESCQYQELTPAPVLLTR